MPSSDLHTNPEHWSASGGIYFCRQDARFLVPKRNPWLGWTINFAHPLADLTLVALVVAPVLLVALTQRPLK